MPHLLSLQLFAGTYCYMNHPQLFSELLDEGSMFLCNAGNSLQNYASLWLWRVQYNYTVLYAVMLFVTIQHIFNLQSQLCSCHKSSTAYAKQLTWELYKAMDHCSVYKLKLWHWPAVVHSCEATNYATVADGHLRRFYSVAASNLLVTAAATAFKQCSEYY
jgi:hypothetical protein